MIIGIIARVRLLNNKMLNKENLCNELIITKMSEKELNSGQFTMFEGLKKLRNWLPPENWLVVSTLDTHTAGEPLRIVVSGFPEVPGDTIVEKIKYLKENLDHLRRAIIWEPRGHADMYGAILTEPVTPEADFGVIFLTNEGYSSMCGHAIIAIGKVVVEAGLVDVKEPITEVKVDTPAGLVRIFAEVEGGKVKWVRFRNVPSFTLYMDEVVEIPGLGEVRYDLAYGGAFYVFVSAKDVGLRCVPEHYRRLIEVGMAIKEVVSKVKDIKHPFSEELSFLYGTIFVDEPASTDSHSRHACIFANGEVDRSPTGTGVSARLAILYDRGEVCINEELVIESIIGTKFTGKVVEEVRYGPYRAIVPEVGGTAHIIAKNTLIIDPNDPLRYGFFIR